MIVLVFLSNRLQVSDLYGACAVAWQLHHYITDPGSCSPHLLLGKASTNHPFTQHYCRRLRSCCVNALTFSPSRNYSRVRKTVHRNLMQKGKAHWPWLQRFPVDWEGCLGQPPLRQHVQGWRQTQSGHSRRCPRCLCTCDARKSQQLKKTGCNMPWSFTSRGGVNSGFNHVFPANLCAQKNGCLSDQKLHVDGECRLLKKSDHA